VHFVGTMYVCSASEMAGKRLWEHLAFQNFLGEAQTPVLGFALSVLTLTTRASPLAPPSRKILDTARLLPIFLDFKIHFVSTKIPSLLSSLRTESILRNYKKWWKSPKSGKILKIMGPHESLSQDLSNNYQGQIATSEKGHTRRARSTERGGGGGSGGLPHKNSPTLLVAKKTFWGGNFWFCAMNECLFWVSGVNFVFMQWTSAFSEENCTLLQKRALSSGRGYAPPAPSPWIRPWTTNVFQTHLTFSSFFLFADFGDRSRPPSLKG
jgi:hypothetical protein